MRNPFNAFMLFCLLAGCGAGGIDTAVKLADALKREGLDWQETGTVERDRKPPRGVKEAIALRGDGLLLEVYRVEDEKLFKTAAVALALRRGLEPEESENALVDAFAHRPFVVAVVEEPEPGTVRRAFRRVFPREFEPEGD